MIVIGCGKAKLDRRAPARELYTGCLFVMARRYVEASGQRWAILSAKHGLVLPDEQLYPYDVQAGKSRGWAVRWGSFVAGQCAAALEQYGERELVVLAGVEYATPLVEALGELLPSMVVRQPLAGLGLGLRMSWFKTHTGSIHGR